ncbi:MAG: tRNA (N6-threonylcarbamoyladenosine(37)-N6)-methyltransferase TrmO [Bacteroidales bacterium]|nr:tRNA (N6-threonylcarbamoyladenosine(37)-N6)-methyltransferase TrmO [Bacteroidales bacterium]
MEIEAIAYYRCPLPGKFGAPRQAGLAPALKGLVTLEAPYAGSQALRGLESFSHAWLIWGFHLNGSRNSRTVRPPRLGGNVRVGVFASRSPFRPNGMGLSAVRIESVDLRKGTIEVSGADLADGTPIYDIKPYVPYSDSIPDATPGFCAKDWPALEVNFTPEAEASLRDALDDDRFDALVQILRLDPRPQYQDDPDRIYGLDFSGLDVMFRVDSGYLIVTGAREQDCNQTQNDL